LRRFIGTFHKTGTALFAKILLKAEAEGFLVPWFFHKTPEEPHSWDVGFDNHSKRIIAQIQSEPDGVRCVVSIRDPRDVIVSAAYYHQRSSEQWLHKPRKEFGGMTYQQKTNSLATQQERFVFEMSHSAGWQIKSMLKLPIHSASLLLTRLELLVVDTELREFSRLFDFLQFSPAQTDSLLRIARECSLFSKEEPAETIHVRSGKPRQFETEFDSSTLARYDEIFGDAAERLGYSR
jgi:hypothetical protein